VSVSDVAMSLFPRDLRLPLSCGGRVSKLEQRTCVPQASSLCFFQNKLTEPALGSVVVHDCDPITQEAEVVEA
jgi:hypothetical protein